MNRISCAAALTVCMALTIGAGRQPAIRSFAGQPAPPPT